MDPIVNDYVSFTKKWEGGLSRDTADSASAFPCPTAHDGKSGWHTNVGVTYKVWKSKFGPNADDRFYAMNNDDWWQIFKTLYWDAVKGDRYTSKNIAIFVTGMAWGSGAGRAGKILQGALNKLGKNLKVDGDIGDKTIEAANSVDPRQLYDQLLADREAFFRSIAQPGSDNAKFLKGWLNRLADYKNKFRP